MAVVFKGATNLYFYLFEEIADHRTENWPLMRTPLPGLVILTFYLLTVLEWLPKFMQNRPPFDLRKYIALYNGIQIGCCAYVVFQSLKLGWFNGYKLICQPVDDGPLSLEYAWKACYFYFIIKVIDLMDTIFFVLRKKQNQVSFLHVYHHCGMVAVAWSMVKWVPGGHTSLLVTINSFVHVIMYSYYLLTSWDETCKRSLWWKKYVTQIQILQFTLLLLHFIALALAPRCEFPRQPAYILIPQNLFMVILFCDFYYKSYIKPNKINTN